MQLIAKSELISRFCFIIFTKSELRVKVLFRYHEGKEPDPVNPVFNLAIDLMPNIAYARYCEGRFREECYSNLQVSFHTQGSLAALFNESHALPKHLPIWALL